MAATTDNSPFQIQTHYIKDLSFENPHAPEVYAALTQSQPDVNVNIDVAHRHLSGRSYEVVLSLRVHTTVADKTAFLVDMQHGALINVHPDVPEADIKPMLLKEGPRFIFPFARAALADTTRDGGFPPLVVNPIDFDLFYERNKKANGDASQADGPAETLAEG